MEKILSVKSTGDAVGLAKEVKDLLHSHVTLYIQDKSTTRLLFTGFVSVSTLYIIKSYISMLLVKRRSGLKGPMPLPVLGNFVSLMTGGLADVHMNIVRKYGKTTIFFEGMNSVIQTADPELIKAITIKDFRYFISRRNFGLEEYKPIDSMLTTLSGDAWKNARSILTTAFTAGKLKPMTFHIKNMADVFCQFIEDRINKDELLGSKKFSNFATDVVCSNFFGVNVDTINNPDHPLPKAISKAFGAEFTTDWRIIVLFLFPKFGAFLARNNLMRVFHQESIDYLSELSDQIIEDRRSKKTVRNDFIQLMVDHTELEENGEADTKTEEESEELKTYKNMKKTLSNSEILSQAILFMMVGTDTTAVTLSWVSHNLAMYPEIQDKLIQEIDDALERHNGEINYDSVNDIEYLNSVISETQRMYPITLTDRVCAEDHEINGLKFKKGDSVNMLIHAMMHDKENYSEPDKFIPGRERHHDTFTPFGSGPRVCIAQRFALLEIKTLMVSILKSYKFEKCEKTVEKPAIDNSGLCKPKNEILFKVVRR